ncbi:hypothetical protein K3G63_09245 [Hymenobacter sp. HSC-4F20]|uniref:DUF6970 domain-containing protein n=1 Tax=Hymenobacter sp. HSC-4F20 TaxID=2864135 RepID=UPI001C729F12|nr:hypothetical protein [Hymenobacter sp. HSC-4F20]MBX0290621.1 hypothetical protein [Hymenobacter sp. HSC-4F20]
MRKIVYPLAAFALLLSACDEIDIEKETPDCIRQKAINLSRETPCDEGAFVKEYLFQGRTVYVLSSGHCIADGSDEVVDENCNQLGYLGGFVGTTTINGESFAKAEFRRTIWQQATGG